MREAAVGKARESRAVQQACFAENAGRLVACATAMNEALSHVLWDLIDLARGEEDLP